MSLSVQASLAQLEMQVGRSMHLSRFVQELRSLAARFKPQRPLEVVFTMNMKLLTTVEEFAATYMSVQSVALRRVAHGAPWHKCDFPSNEYQQL